MEWFDPYEIRARIAPALIIFLPLLIALVSIAPEILNSPFSFISSGIISLAIIYGLSFLVRHLGKRIEPQLWKNWDGAPSTRFMRWRDTKFARDLKEQMHNAVRKLCHIELRSEKEEFNSSQDTDNQIEQAFYQVRAIVRRDDPNGIWSKHNAEYGFNRNMYGSRNIWIMFSFLGLLICLIVYYCKGDNISIISVILNLLILLSSLLFKLAFQDKFVKEAADRYAENVWNSFLLSAMK